MPWDEVPTCQNTIYRIFLAFDSMMKIYVSCWDSCETVMACLLEELAGILQVLLQLSLILRPEMASRSLRSKVWTKERLFIEAARFHMELIGCHVWLGLTP